MMRTPRVWAVAVRRPDGRITTAVAGRGVRRDAPPLAAPARSARHRRAGRVAVHRLPRARPVGAALGVGRRRRGRGGDRRGAIIFSFVIAIGFALALFKVTPGVLAKLLGHRAELALPDRRGPDPHRDLPRLPDRSCRSSRTCRRVFQYHAAEHKAINALEAGDELTPGEGASATACIHLRCGTAFLLWVMVVVDPGLRLRRQGRLLALADPLAHPAAAADRRHRLRGDPPRRPLRHEPRRPPRPAARPVAAAADDARAVATTRSRSRSRRCRRRSRGRRSCARARLRLKRGRGDGLIGPRSRCRPAAGVRR